MNAKEIANAVKTHLIGLAINDKLPVDMNELNIADLEAAIQAVLPNNEDKEVENALHYLSDGDELSSKQMIEAIRNWPDQHDLIDNVDGVVVWEPLEHTFTCMAFLDLISVNG